MWVTTRKLFQIALCFVASAIAAPLEDTEDVKAAKASFMKAFEAAEKGDHAALAPAPVATAYLDDSDDVAAAKAEFAATFANAEKGIINAPMVAAPIAPAAPIVTYASTPAYYGNYFPTAYYNLNAPLTYANYGAYTGFPNYYPSYTYSAFGAPLVAVAPAKAEAAEEWIDHRQKLKKGIFTKKLCYKIHSDEHLIFTYLFWKLSNGNVKEDSYIERLLHGQ